MEKSFLEKQIEQRAQNRFESDLKVFIDAIKKTEIGKRLRIKVEANSILLIDDRRPALFNFYGSIMDAENCTNISTLKEELIMKYLKEESEILLNKIDQLKDYFEMVTNL